MKNYHNFEEIWPVVKGKLMKRFPELTESDFDIDEFNQEVFLERLQKRTGKSRSDLLETINKLLIIH